MRADWSASRAGPRLAHARRAFAPLSPAAALRRKRRIDSIRPNTDVLDSDLTAEDWIDEEDIQTELFTGGKLSSGNRTRTPRGGSPRASRDSPLEKQRGSGFFGLSGGSSSGFFS